MAKKQKIRKFNLNRPNIGWWFVSPFVFGFLTYFIFTIVDSVRFSFSQVSLGAKGYELAAAGFANYHYALREDPDFFRMVIEMVGSLFANIPIMIIFSLFIAVLLNQKLPFKTFYRAVFFIPVVVSVGLVEMSDASNAVLQAMGSMGSIETGAEMVAGGLMSFSDVSAALQNLNFSPKLISYIVGAVDNIMTVINQSGVQIVIFLVGLQSISPAIYESAIMEGATGWETFWKITFPMISPMILVNLFFTIIDFMTRNNNPIMVHIKNATFSQSKVGEGAAMAWIYFAIIGVILAFFAFVVSKYVFYQNREN
ncbi:MAG: sugar ABC transporter permease [Oscillospiraceae bacterium]